jgi:hypothetical protein
LSVIYDIDYYRSIRMQSLNVPGKICSLNHDGCLAEIGGVIASMSKETIKALSIAYTDIHSKIGTVKERTIVPSASPENGWTAIGFDVERNVYSLNLRGVCWEVSQQVLDAFIREGALPFIATAAMSEFTNKITARA